MATASCWWVHIASDGSAHSVLADHTHRGKKKETKTRLTCVPVWAGLRGADLPGGKMPLRVLNDLLHHFLVQPIGEEAGKLLLERADADRELSPKVLDVTGALATVVKAGAARWYGDHAWLLASLLPPEECLVALIVSLASCLLRLSPGPGPVRPLPLLPVRHGQVCWSRG